MADGPAAQPSVDLRPYGLDETSTQAVRDVLEAAGLTGAADAARSVVVIGPARPAVAALHADGELVVVVHPEPGRAETSELVAAGAAGIVPLEELADTLVPAVYAVAAGLVVVPAEGREALRRPLLSKREQEVLALVVMGLTNADIGRRLFLAESTVKYHLLSVYEKLGVRNRKEATELVLDPRNGLATGVLGLTGGRQGRRKGYSEPKVG
jgi:DNA-binding CsgD family transcriptional regulator